MAAVRPGVLRQTRRVRRQYHSAAHSTRLNTQSRDIHIHTHHMTRSPMSDEGCASPGSAAHQTRRQRRGWRRCPRTATAPAITAGAACDSLCENLAALAAMFANMVWGVARGPRGAAACCCCSPSRPARPRQQRKEESNQTREDAQTSSVRISPPTLRGCVRVEGKGWR
jgi:hypothetical protein